MQHPRPVVASCLVLLLAVACSGGPGCRPNWNVLLISIDTLRADHLSGYGYVRDTSPHIDALADSSWVFETAYVPVPRTGPSVAALLTGMFPEHVDRWRIPDELDTMAETLGERNWATMAAVDNANLSRQSGYAQGFDVYVETWEEMEDEVGRTRLITDAAVEHLQRFADAGEPFFMWLHYVNPHRPYAPPSGYDTKFMNDAHFDESVRLPRTRGHVGGIRPGVYVEGEHRLAYYVAQYDGEIAYVDDEVGMVLDALKARFLLKNTLVVLTADHGEGLGEQNVYFKHGPHVLESHVRVPLMIRHPGDTTRPQRIRRAVGTIDVMPTILDLLGVSSPLFEAPRSAPRAGQSLAAVRDGGDLTDHRRDVFFASRNFWGARSGEWKFILKTRDDGEEGLGESHQLFNVLDDPGESRNLYGIAPMQSIRMLDRLNARLQLQRQVGGEAEGSDRFDGLPEEVLRNLRTLGYIR
jgi:arylsulfatase